MPPAFPPFARWLSMRPTLCPGPREAYNTTIMAHNTEPLDPFASERERSFENRELRVLHFTMNSFDSNYRDADSNRRLFMWLQFASLSFSVSVTVLSGLPVVHDRAGWL